MNSTVHTGRRVHICLLLSLLMANGGCAFSRTAASIGADQRQTMGVTKNAGVCHDGALAILIPVERRYEFRTESKDRIVLIPQEVVKREVRKSHVVADDDRPVYTLGYLSSTRSKSNVHWYPRDWHATDATITDLPDSLRPVRWYAPVKEQDDASRLRVPYLIDDEAVWLDVTAVNVQHGKPHGVSGLISLGLLPPAMAADIVTLPIQMRGGGLMWPNP